MDVAVIGPLVAQEPTHWTWVPRLCAAARAFIPRHHSDQDPDAVVHYIMTHFVASTGRLGAWVWTTDDVTVDGHLLVHLDDKADGSRVAFVDQVESRVPTTPDLRARVCASVRAWADAGKAPIFEGWITRRGLLRLYHRFGFPVEPVMTAVRCPVDAIGTENTHGLRVV